MPTLQTSSPRYLRFLWPVLILSALFMANLCLGSAKIPVSRLFAILWQEDTSSTSFRIVRYVRLIRSLSAVLCGMALGVSGYLLQTALNNPLASPNVIGVNAGAGFTSVLFSACLPKLAGFSLFASFFGALIAVLTVFLLAKATRASRTTIVLCGVAVSSFFSACTDTVITLFPDTQIQRIDFLVGSFSFVSEKQLQFGSIFILVGIVLALLLERDLQILLLGEETAQALGLKVERTRTFALILAAILSGSAVSMCGLIGFIGLIIPHICRMIIGSNKRNLIPYCALGGAILALGCDLIARLLFAPYEIPVGIILS
ncbi:iron ABC transporter permease, partial [uncultured Sphaerochaeta sp.]|uniref:FecCD family ABC transporter permease n=1 Tax=uncultured Sphaerochaeta sp. TaxID=886478 RepID=UPI002A0A30C8